MIYLFTWNSRYLIQKEAQKWKHAFEEKYGIENVIHINSIETSSPHFIVENMLSRSLFSEKRLLLIDGFPYSWDRAFTGAAEIENSILENLDKIPEETLVVFLSENPDKRKTAYKKLLRFAETRLFSVSWEKDVLRILSQRYSWKIDIQALLKLIYLKGWNLQKSISEIEKLLITNKKISSSSVEAYIVAEFEESIFVFIDTLLNKNKKKIFSEFQNLLNFSNFYALYQSILANLRVFLYIEFLKIQKKSPEQIGNILKLWNRKFLINKRYLSSYNDIKNLYIDLLNFDKNMKFWKFINSDEDNMKRKLERVFLHFLA